MRIAKLIFVGSLAALVLVAAPALAKNSDGQKTEDKQASASCQAYQPAPDGSWTPLPCGEMGAKAPTKNTTRGTDQRTRYARPARTDGGAANGRCSSVSVLSTRCRTLWKRGIIIA